MAQWTNVEDGPNNPPQCTLIYQYLVHVVGTDQRALLEFKRTGEPLARSLNTQIAQFGIAQFAIELGSSHNKSGNRVYYSPTMSAVVPDDELKAVLARYAQ